MDFKKKLQSLVKPKTSAPVENEITVSSLNDEAGVSKFKEHIQEAKYDPRIDQENINSIEACYFSGEDGFNPSNFELKRLTADPNLAEIDAIRNKLRKQLQSVSKRVSELILENHPAYATELRRVMELQQSLQTALGICTNGRGLLSQSQKDFTVASLRMLANHRKRQQLLALMKSLKTIKTLRRTDVRLREMLEKEDYVGAIELCLECQKAASTFRHYTCISELSSKLQDTLEMIEEQLDVALSKTCHGFDEVHYRKVQTAYQLLGKSQTAMDQLHMHFASTIHNTAFTIVLGYVELYSGKGDSSFQKKQYTDLCKFITSESFIPCLKDLCKALWGVLLSYHKTRQWHEGQDKIVEADIEDAEHDSTEESFNRKYIQQKLQHGRARIWQDVQLKVRAFLRATGLSTFKFNEFTSVLNIISRLMAIGEEFSSMKSELLQEEIHEQTVHYFEQYHAARMEEVCTYLDAEAWQHVPVRSTFTILQLLEFRFLRDQQASSGLHKKSMGTSLDTILSDSQVQPTTSYFNQESSPFDDQQDDDETEDFFASNDADALSDSDEDVPDELRADFIDEGNTSANSYSSQARKAMRRRQSSAYSEKKPIILTNSSLICLRQFGKYMRMMDLLEPIAFHVIQGMSQLFDFYLYSVYTRFASAHMGFDVVDNKPCISSKLQTTIERIASESSHGNGTHQNGDFVMQYDGFGSPENLHGLKERLVAVESLVYLAKQFEFLQANLERAVIPTNKKAFLQQFYSQTITPVCELRYPVYRAVTEKILNQDQIVSAIAQVKWDIKEIMSEHSSYVDHILREFEMFSSRLTEIRRHVPLSQEVCGVLWEQCSKAAAQLFVEGYANAKKCTNEGRALMQLNFQQFLVKFERIADIRPVPGREFVEMYVKVYYLPDVQLEQWTKDRKEYTPRQIRSVIQCVPHLNKKFKQRLLSQIDDPEKNAKKENSPFAQLQNFSKRVGSS